MVIATIAWITSAHEGPQPRKPALSDRAKRGESDGSSRAQLGSAKSESRTIYAFALFQGTSSDPAESELGWRGASGLRFNSDRQWASVAEVFMERGRPRFRGFSKPGIPWNLVLLGTVVIPMSGGTCCPNCTPTNCHSERLPPFDTFIRIRREALLSSWVPRAW